MAISIEEREYQAEFNQKRKQKKTNIKQSSKGVKSTALKNPIFKLLIPFGVEIGTGGIFPAWTCYVIWSWVEEKKSGASPNIAEYIMVGSLAVAVDAFGLLTGISAVFLIFSYAITFPCLGFLWLWRFIKYGSKSTTSTKIRSKIIKKK